MMKGEANSGKNQDSRIWLAEKGGEENVMAGNKTTEWETGGERQVERFIYFHVPPATLGLSCQEGAKAYHQTNKLVKRG